MRCSTDFAREHAVAQNISRDRADRFSPVKSPPTLPTTSGVHVTPGHPAGNYIVTWMRGEATVGPPTSLNRDIPSGFVELTPEDAALHHATRRFFSRPTSYARRYTRLPAARNFSYTSPEIHHAVVAGLVPGTAYLYHVGHDAGPLSPVLRFTTLPEVRRRMFLWIFFAQLTTTMRGSANGRWWGGQGQVVSLEHTFRHEQLGWNEFSY